MFIVLDRWYKPVTKVADEREFYAAGWTHQELCSALNGNLVRNSFVEFDLDSTGVRQCTVESLIKDYESFDPDQIADLLGLGTSWVHKIIKKFKNQIRKG